MNDFTKEELLKLFSIVSHHCARIATDDGEDDLLMKLKSMIDNYCDKDGWVHRQSPEIEGDNWCGGEWPKSPWALFKDIYGQECLAQQLDENKYGFLTNDRINVNKLCMFQELEHKHPLVVAYLKDKTNWTFGDE